MNGDDHDNDQGYKNFTAWIEGDQPKGPTTMTSESFATFNTRDHEVRLSVGGHPLADFAFRPFDDGERNLKFITEQINHFHYRAMAIKLESAFGPKSCGPSLVAQMSPQDSRVIRIAVTGDTTSMMGYEVGEDVRDQLVRDINAAVDHRIKYILEPTAGPYIPLRFTAAEEVDHPRIEPGSMKPADTQSSFDKRMHTSYHQLLERIMDALAPLSALSEPLSRDEQSDLCEYCGGEYPIAPCCQCGKDFPRDVLKLDGVGEAQLCPACYAEFEKEWTAENPAPFVDGKVQNPVHTYTEAKRISDAHGVAPSTEYAYAAELGFELIANIPRGYRIDAESFRVDSAIPPNIRIQCSPVEEPAESPTTTHHLGRLNRLAELPLGTIIQDADGNNWTRVHLGFFDTLNNRSAMLGGLDSIPALWDDPDLTTIIYRPTDEAPAEPASA